MRILRIMRILLSSSTAANFGSCGIGGRGDSEGVGAQAVTGAAEDQECG